MIIVPERDIAGLIGPADCLAAVEGVFAAMARGTARNFPVVREALGHADALYGFKSGFDAESLALGLKSGGFWPGNMARGLTNHQSTIFLFDADTGQCRAIVGGNRVEDLQNGDEIFPAMLEAITDRTRVVLVCTPNNPTGPSVTHAELEAFIAKVPRDVLVVVDEAYLEFVEGEGEVDGLSLRREHGNVMLLRTFSKAYGLAGLRVGYAVAPEPVAEALRKTATPFGVNLLAQAAAIASLEAKDELDVRVKGIVAERERVLAALREAGWQMTDSQANFVWFPLGERTGDFVAACTEAGLSVRPYGTEGVRVSIGETEANDRLIEVAREFLRAAS